MEQKPKSQGDFYKKLFSYAIIAFIISTAVFLAYFIISNLIPAFSYIGRITQKFLSALTPLVLGVVLAYLFNKPVMLIERLFRKVKFRRELSVGLFYILILGIIISVINFIEPKMQTSLIQLINNDLPKYSTIINYNIQKSMEWLKSSKIGIGNTSIETYISKFSSISTIILNSIMDKLVILTKGITNFILAMVFAFYLLQKKEKILGSVKNIICLYCSERTSRRILGEAGEINGILSGYISGVLADSMAIIILTTIGLKLIGHRYFLLMGVTFGILNLIPYFGMIIGAVIACLLALLQGVPEVIYTALTIIIIQQIDGNVIQPRIIGDKVGLGPLWVISAILVFGKFWGIIGTLVAVPFTAFLKIVAIRIIDRKKTLMQAAANTAEKQKAAAS